MWGGEVVGWFMCMAVSKLNFTYNNIVLLSL